MSKRAEDFAVRIHNTALRKAEKYASEHDMGVLGEVSYGWGFKAGAITGYEQAEKDLADVAAFSSGPDGFYYGKGYQQGKKDAEKHLGWHSVEESLPPVDEEVIVLTQVPAFGRISFAHLVNSDVMITIDGKPYKPEAYSGWNIPGVKFWMPMPKIPNKDE